MYHWKAMLCISAKENTNKYRNENITSLLPAFYITTKMMHHSSLYHQHLFIIFSTTRSKQKGPFHMSLLHHTKKLYGWPHLVTGSLL